MMTPPQRIVAPSRDVEICGTTRTVPGAFMREWAWLRTAMPEAAVIGAFPGKVFAARAATELCSIGHALGTRGCKAELLADFLARNSCETLFLVGDIVDGWRLR